MGVDLPFGRIDGVVQRTQKSMELLKYLIPRIRGADLLPMFGVAIVGGFVGGTYGIVHDQITFTISEEYFTKLKFQQFHYADLGLGNRVFASTIGFLATWWVGLIAGWFIARRVIPNQNRRAARHQVRQGFACVIVCGLLSGTIAYFCGLSCSPEANDSSWQWAVRHLEIADHRAFIRVAWIHNAGYLGGAIGLVLALVIIRPKTAKKADSSPGKSVA